MVVLDHRPLAQHRLYCLPPAGHGAAFYQSWVPHLADDTEPCVVQLGGRGAADDRPLATDPSPVVTALADLIHAAADPRPFALFGHSGGALLAYEITRRLRRTRREVPFLLALSSLGPPHVDSSDALTAVLSGSKDRGGLPDLLGPVPARITGDRRGMRGLLLPFLADLVLMLQLQHHHRDEPPLETPIALYGGRDDPFVVPEHLAAWNDLASLPTTPHLFPGGHAYLTEHTADLVRRLGRDLTATARRHHPKTGPHPAAR
jgi:surfactin synthase thioesterase subunit